MVRRTGLQEGLSVALRRPPTAGQCGPPQHAGGYAGTEESRPAPSPQMILQWSSHPDCLIPPDPFPLQGVVSLKKPGAAKLGFSPGIPAVSPGSGLHSVSLLWGGNVRGILKATGDGRTVMTERDGMTKELSDPQGIRGKQPEAERLRCLSLWATGQRTAEPPAPAGGCLNGFWWKGLSR